MTASPAPLDEHLHALVGRLLDADGLLLLLDFDGSLAPIAERPDEVALPDSTRAALADLRDADDVRVAVVSGRGLADLRERVGLDGVVYAGNHGLETYVDGEERVHPVARDARDRIAALVERIDAELADVDGAFVEDKGVTASVHYRLADDDSVPEVERAVHDFAGETEDVHVTSGKQVLELRPDVDWDKGRATDWISDRCVPDDESWLHAYVGDDRTDEDAFRALPASGRAIKVGRQPPTAADYRVDDPAAVRNLLDWLAEYGVTFLATNRDDHPTASPP